MDGYVNRDNPHIFHQDYWALRAVRQTVVDFTERYSTELQGQRALDFGAGNSPYIAHFNALNCELLRADLASADPEVLHIRRDGRVPVEDGSMAAVLSIQVLEHVPDVQAYLREALRMLRPGGVFLLTTHGAWHYHPFPTDMRRWTVDGLPYECEVAGFKVEKVITAVGILACATHLRSHVVGRILQRVPVLRWLRLLVYFLANVRMGIEDFVMPQRAMKWHPQLVMLFARKHWLKPIQKGMDREIYEKYWEPNQAWSPSNFPFYPFERKLVERIGASGDTCLDYGCGDARRYGQILQTMGFDYRGFDISQTAVRQAVALGVKVSLLNPDGTTSLAENSCDLAICFEVFEHLLEPHRALSEIRRVLKPGGYLICSVPNAAYFARRIEFLFTGFLNPKGDPTIERSAPWRDPYIRFFSAGTLRRFLSSEGFTEVKISGSPFTLDFLLTWLPVACAGSRAEPTLRRLLNSLSWLGESLPSLFGRRLLGLARKRQP